MQFVYNEKLDTMLLMELYGDSQEDAIFGFEQFLIAIPKQFEEAKNAYNSGDIELFRQKMHKIKPSFSFVGLSSITTKAAELEKRCKEVSQIEDLLLQYNSFSNSVNEYVPLINVELDRLKALN